jgi:hypothetical protein
MGISFIGEIKNKNKIAKDTVIKIFNLAILEL